MTIATLDACLIRYHVIGQRLIYSDFILNTLAPKIDPVNIFSTTKDQTKEDSGAWEGILTSTICFHFNVVQLFSLLEVHKDLTTHLTTETQKLEDSLSDAWKVIEEQSTRICKWRK